MISFLIVLSVLIVLGIVAGSILLRLYIEMNPELKELLNNKSTWEMKAKSMKSDVEIQIKEME